MGRLIAMLHAGPLGRKALVSKGKLLSPEQECRLDREKVLPFFLLALEDWAAGLSFEQTVREVRETGRMVLQKVRSFFVAGLSFGAKAGSFFLQGLLHRETCPEDFASDLSFNLQPRELDHMVLLQDLAGLLVFHSVRLVFDRVGR